MGISTKCIRIIGLWAALLLLAGIPVAWGQSTAPTSSTSIKIGGKTCVPDQGCDTSSVVFTDAVRTGVTNRVWNFGDGSATVTVAGSDSTARHPYLTAGTYTVTLTRTVNGQDQTVSRNFQVYERPRSFSNWKTDTTICQGERITLDPYSGGPGQSGLTFLWYPKGQTSQSIEVDSSGCYSVEVTDPATGCSTQDRINVDVCGEKKESQGVKWYFGQNAGLDFSGGGTPQAITDGKLSTIEGSSSIANTKGILLFYTDGITIFDKDGAPLKSLDPRDSAATATKIPLGGNTRSTQSALIVPKPTCKGCEYLYYVYTTSEINGTKQLTYSIVDMRQNSGKGAVTQKNIPVTNLGTEQSASVRNDRDSTYWVITRVYGTNQFQIRHLTEDAVPTVTTFNGGQVLDSLTNAEGYIKIGPADTTSGNEGNRPMAVVVPGPPKNSVDLFTFNDSTGTMTFLRTVNVGDAPPKAYGVEFSPDGKSLYVSMLADTNSDGSQKGASYVLKYDLNQPDSLVNLSRTVVDSSTTRQYGSLQIGPDGRIYVAIQGSTSLGTIENPNGGLLDSLIFNPQGQSLGGKVSQLGLPNLVSNFNDQSSGPGFTYADTCARSPTIFQASPNCQKLKETYTWLFGDGSQPVSTTALQPQLHTYQRPGDYTVSLRIVTQTSQGGICKDTTINDTITIVETPPALQLGADTIICNRRGLTLDLKVTAKTYVWLVNGAVAGRQKTITLTRPGYYYVIGYAANGGCFQSDTIRVQIRPAPSLDLGPDTLFCYRSSVNIRVPQQVWTEFQWSNGGTTRQISVTSAGQYSVVGRFTLNGATCENSDTIQVRELPKITLNARLTNPLTCTLADGSIDVTPTPARSYTYAWSQNGTPLSSLTNVQTNLAPGTYTVNVTDVVYECKVDSSFTLVPPNPPTFNLTPQASLCVGDNGQTQLVASGANLSYRWPSLNATTGTITVNQIGRYEVIVTDPRGCTATGASLVVDLCEPRLNIPDAFTPNNDGQNDVLAVFASYVTDYQLRIYNRWGEIIFESTNPEQKWDGTYRGVLYPPMMYPYIISYKSQSFPERGTIVKRGSVLLVR
ncbi:PKD domain-containing protein [Spirosoma pomorum]